MIEIKFNPSTFALDIEGHAEYDEKGKDIVCSAISTLFYTLAESLYEVREMMEEDIVFDDTDGRGHIECKPKSEYEGNLSLIYWTILKGFEIVAKNYEKYVKLVEIVP